MVTMGLAPGHSEPCVSWTGTEQESPGSVQATPVATEVRGAPGGVQSLVLGCSSEWVRFTLPTTRFVVVGSVQTRSLSS